MIMLSTRRLAAAAAVVVSFASGGAYAAQIQGSASIFTSRPCPTQDVNQTCNISGVPRNFTQLNGGYGQQHSATASNGLGSWQAKVNFGGLNNTTNYDYNLPTIGVSSFAGVGQRVGSSATGFRTYRNNSSFGLDLSFLLYLNYENSLDAAGEGEFREGHLNAVFGVVPISSVAGRLDANAIISNPNAFPDCGPGSSASAAAELQSSSGGIHHEVVRLNTACNGGKITIGAGQEFALVATMQAISNRGGFISAMHTFEVQLDEENVFIAGTDTVVDPQVLRNSVVSNVPEPGVWALIIVGFAGMGGALRNKRRQLAAG